MRDAPLFILQSRIGKAYPRLCPHYELEFVAQHNPGLTPA
jgi:hypothetical protein